MSPFTQPAPTALILKADRYYADAIRTSVQREYPTASTHVVTHLADADSFLQQTPVDLLLTGVQLLDGDVLDKLAGWLSAPRRCRRVLVITGRRERYLISALDALQVDGIFDPSTDEPANFAIALRQVHVGTRYYSRSVLDALASSHRARSRKSALTATEQLVLAVIGDGCDDGDAAARLDMAASSIRTVREQLHRKLGVRHKGELVRIAAELGYVCIGAHGVIRPGFSRLLAARAWRKSRREGVAAPAPASADVPATAS